MGTSKRKNAPHCPGGGGWSQLELTDALVISTNTEVVNPQIKTILCTVFSLFFLFVQLTFSYLM